MQVKALFSGATLWLMLTTHAIAAQSVSADDWLQRLQEAQGTQDYQGAFVYERKGGVFSTHQVWRQINAQGQAIERFLQLNGPAHEVMRVSSQVTCISSAVAANWPQLMCGQLKHYSCKIYSNGIKFVSWVNQELPGIRQQSCCFRRVISTVTLLNYQLTSPRLFL